jgi:hypothetical protein
MILKIFFYDFLLFFYFNLLYYFVQIFFPRRTNMATAKPVEDRLDYVSDYFVNKAPDKLFKTIHLLIGEWPKYLMSSTSKAIANSAKVFGNVVGAFDIKDFFENINNLRNRILNKTKDSVSVAAADVYYEAHFAAEFLVNSNIISIAASTMQTSALLAGITLSYSFGMKSIDNLSNYFKVADIKTTNDKDLLLKNASLNYHLAKLVKSVSFLAMGIMLTYSAIYAAILPASYMLFASTAALISSFAIAYFEGKYNFPSYFAK